MFVARSAAARLNSPRSPGPIYEIVRQVIAQENGIEPRLSTHGGTSDGRFLIAVFQPIVARLRRHCSQPGQSDQPCRTRCNDKSHRFVKHSLH